MNAGNRLKQLREEKGLSQSEVAKIIGVGRTTYLKWENGENQPTRKLDQLSKFFGVSIDYLLGKSDVKNIKSKNLHSRGIRIPVLGRVVAGIPIESVEEILDYEEITPEFGATGKFFSVKIRGHSIEPRTIE